MIINFRFSFIYEDLEARVGPREERRLERSSSELESNQLETNWLFEFGENPSRGNLLAFCDFSITATILGNLVFNIPANSFLISQSTLSFFSNFSLFYRSRQVPAWKKIWKPKWIETQVPVVKDIKVEAWKQYWVPEWWVKLCWLPLTLCLTFASQ